MQTTARLSAKALDLPAQSLLTIPQAQHALGGIARATCYKLINTGCLPTVRIGKRRFVTPAGIETCIDRLEKAEAGRPAGRSLHVDSPGGPA